MVNQEAHKYTLANQLFRLHQLVDNKISSEFIYHLQNERGVLLNQEHLEAYYWLLKEAKDIPPNHPLHPDNVKKSKVKISSGMEQQLFGYRIQDDMLLTLQEHKSSFKYLKKHRNKHQKIIFPNLRKAGLLIIIPVKVGKKIKKWTQPNGYFIRNIPQFKYNPKFKYELMLIKKGILNILANYLYKGNYSMYDEQQKEQMLLNINKLSVEKLQKSINENLNCLGIYLPEVEEKPVVMSSKQKAELKELLLKGKKHIEEEMEKWNRKDLNKQES